MERGLWHGFNVAALVAVVSSALGGLIVSAVLKYADSVLKVGSEPHANARPLA